LLEPPDVRERWLPRLFADRARRVERIAHSPDASLAPQIDSRSNWGASDV
jgi:hypothetical protein